jgi:hypothetical protein
MDHYRIRWWCPSRHCYVAGTIHRLGYNAAVLAHRYARENSERHTMLVEVYNCEILVAIYRYGERYHRPFAPPVTSRAGRWPSR